MRPWLTRVLLVALMVMISGTLILSVAEDYLVIKKKGGPTQKVPLNFSPEQIESFQVESSGPSQSAPSVRGQSPAAEDEETVPPSKEPDKPAPMGRPESRPTQMSPETPSSQPMILRQKPAPGPRVTEQESVVPSVEQQGPTPKRPERSQQPRAETPVAPVKRPITGPVAAAVPGGKGSFLVNVYKLPDSIRALPDYSALRPIEALATDRVNLDPSRGQNEPAGLPENAEGLGLRFLGFFEVAGEGIFKWSVQAKDGVRLNIDDKTLIENDGIHDAAVKTGYIHLGQGTHCIVLDSFNSKGAPFLRLLVTPPLGQEQIFSIKNGLAGWSEPAKPYDVLWGQVYFVPKGSYPEGPDFSRLSPIGRIIAPELNISGGEGFPGLPGRKDMVGIRYEGFFNVHGAGIFAFRLVADHFAKLTIGALKIAETTRTSRVDTQGKVGWAFLQQGSYPIRVDFFHPEGVPRLGLYVTEPAKTEEIFSPTQPLQGYVAEEGKVNLIPAFVYFLSPNTKKLPNYNKLSPSGMFFTKSIDYPVDRGSREFPGIPKREDWLGIRFYVKFSLEQSESGPYTFRVVCDDSARLILDKKMVVNVESAGKKSEQTGTVGLEAGSHEMFLDYFQATGPNGIQLYITPPGGEEKIFAFQ
jgi:hypothetical protein